MTISDQHPCARRSRAARLSGLRDCISPLGEINICPAGSRIEAANELTTSKIKSNTIGILTLETAATNVSAVNMVNDYSYGSVSGVLPIAENGQRKRPPLGRAAKRWGIRPSRGNDASGRNDRVLPKMVKTSALHHPLKSQADMRQVHPIDLESATLKSTPPMMVDGRTSKLLKQIGFDTEAGFIFGFTSAMDD